MKASFTNSLDAAIGRDGRLVGNQFFWDTLAWTVGGPYSVAMMLIYVFKCIIIAVVAAASVIVFFLMLNSCVLGVAI